MPLWRAVLSLVSTVAAAVAVSFAVVNVADARATAYCAAYADTPIWYSPFYGQSRGGAVNCGDGVPWQGTLNLKNRNNNNLDTVPVSGNRQLYFGGNVAGCAGAYIHSFLWLNSNGTVTSDTSGENSQCAY